MNNKSIENLKAMVEESEQKGNNKINRQKWPGFIESSVVNFF